MNLRERRINEALGVLRNLGMPREQLNERTAICLLALLNLTESKPWREASNHMLGIRGVLDFARANYERNYAENTRETVRDESIKPLVAAGIVLHNPDAPDRAVNSPRNCYQVEPNALSLFLRFGTDAWNESLTVHTDRKSVV